MADDVTREPDEPGDEAPEPVDGTSEPGNARSRMWLWIVGAVAIVAIVGGAWWLFSGQNVAVPRVVGGDLAAAESALKGAGLELGDVTEEVSDEASGTVVAQDPPAGTQVRSGTAVAIVVSTGPELVTVPDVQGVTVEEAQTTLADAGLESTSVVQYDPDAPKDSVIEQLPAAGDEVAAGTAVGLVVSLGPPQTARVPDVTGQPADTGAATVEQAGFVANTTEVYDSDVRAGQIVSQSPDPGTTLDIGSDVLLAVSLGPPDAGVTVPNTIGQSVSDAQATLDAVGLTSRVVRDYTPRPKDAVVYQQPAGGAQMMAGSTVDLLVSDGPKPADPEPPTAPAPPDGGQKPPPEIEIPTSDVPDVIGMQAEDAKAAVTDAGLRPILIPYRSAEVPEGEVFRQAPEAGSTVVQGYPVLMLVSTGPEGAVQLPYVIDDGGGTE